MNKIVGGMIKTKTSNGRTAKTCVFKPNRDIVVINRRILLTEEDVRVGYFDRSKHIFKYKNLILAEEEIVFYQESFDVIVKIVNELVKL